MIPEDILGLGPDPTSAEISAAYARKTREYQVDPSAPDDVRALAAERLATLATARDTLLSRQSSPPAARLSRREWLWMGAGVAIAILVIALLAVFTRDSTPQIGLVAIDRPAPDLTLTTLDGDPIRLADLRGKIVLVNFWATWCEPCKAETPDLVAASVEFRDRGLVIVGINLTDQDKNLDEVRKFVQRYQITYPIVLDRDQEAQRAFAMFAIPVSYFIDSNGRIRYTRTTVVTRTDIEYVLQKLAP